MPRTRNITRAQWDEANATNSTGDNHNNHACESEKENEGKQTARATRSRTRIGNRVLGSTTTANLRISTTSKGPENTVSANRTKVKGKGRATAPPPKRKKLPLQDITSQFLPAFKAANRGEENETEHSIFQQAEQMVNLVSPLPRAQIPGGDDVLGPTTSMSHPAPTYLDSPLPPSSPPSAITSSPQYPKIHNNPNSSRLSPENIFWDRFDDGRRASQGSPSLKSSSSDPFGFVALERKLKVERRATVPSPLKRHHEEDESDEEPGLILVADTSSPRQVRRLKRSSYQGDFPFPPAISEHPIYDTPPTPHKDKKKRPRLSHEGDRVFSPGSSSMPSTPSPSKPPVQKQAGREDNLKSNLEGSQGVLGRTRNRTARGIDKSEPPATLKDTKNLLELGKSLDDDRETEEEQADPKPVKVSNSKKKTKKPRSAGTKKTKKEKNDDVDYEEVCSLPGSGYSIRLSEDQKWEQERQERAAYFKRLEGYQIEKEDVCVI